VKHFFDTSVLIAAFWGGHPNHEASIKLLASANKKTAACALHSVAELYSGMTALPVRPVIPPEQVLLFVQEVRDRLTLVTLQEEEYVSAISNAAERGFTSGRIYDALLLTCAAKVKAEIIYTWNIKHFRMIAPQLSGHIRTP